VLRKKVHSQQVFVKLRSVLSSLFWNPSPPVEYYEWCINVVDNTIRYHLQDGEAFFAYNCIKLAEKQLKTILLKQRAFLIVYSLIKYKNHQANHFNVFYYVLTFLIVYEMHPCKLETFIDRLEIDYLRRYLKETIDGCDPGENEEDEQDYFNTEDTDFFH
jgi:hypothetical protein